MEKNEKVKLWVNLIKESGEREDEAREINCTLQNDVSLHDGEIAQGEFKCELSGLKDGPYYSLRLNTSNDLAGIPDDELSLDPILTAEAIKKNKRLDYSNEENQSADKKPPTFIATGINGKSCGSNGTFTIEGTLSKSIKNELSFRFPLIFPDGITPTCRLDKKEAGENKITCKVDRQIENSRIFFEQITVFACSPQDLISQYFVNFKVV